MSLGEFIKEKRNLKNWSQRDLAAKSGVSNAEISRIESGKRKEPSSSVLKDIAVALDVPVEDLLQQAGVISDSSTSTTQSSFESSAYVSVEDLSADEIEDVMKYIAFLKSQRK